MPCLTSVRRRSKSRSRQLNASVSMVSEGCPNQLNNSGEDNAVVSWLGLASTVKAQPTWIRSTAPGLGVWRVPSVFPEEDGGFRSAKKSCPNDPVTWPELLNSVLCNSVLSDIVTVLWRPCVMLDQAGLVHLRRLPCVQVNLCRLSSALPHPRYRRLEPSEALGPLANSAGFVC
ncbi:hypothetical protein BGZ63DRAFT_232189 [Mariannaea sp. PMI_226]|nr:hypothetical protein BGZ63DRAFT_232189 [Mariannaea sp. PMI_226]